MLISMFVASGIGGVAVDGLGGDLSAASRDLGEVGVLEVRQSCTPFVVRQEQVPQSLGPGLTFEVFEDGRVEVRVPGLGPLPVVDRLSRVDEVVHEGVESGLIVTSLLIWCEVHCSCFLG
jgi:hypothetical protein